MITLRKAAERGHANHGWLESFHSFSFADYVDPRHMGVGNLRVINEDRIAPGTGFGTHGHRDMEIISVVLAGELAHKDSLGTGNGNTDDAPSGVIRRGDVQRMSAGSGVRHSEFNHASGQTTHFLQIWILPSSTGIAPSYEQKHFPDSAKRGRLVLLAAPGGRDGAVDLHADATLSAGLFDGDEHAECALDPQRIGYVFVASGSVHVNGQSLQAGDAARLDGEARLRLDQGRQAEVLVFDLKP